MTTTHNHPGKRGKDKKRAILDVATQVFREMGFHNASMNIIATRLGGSKTTLYNHFRSKDAIFWEVARNAAILQNQRVSTFIDDESLLLTSDNRHRVHELVRELAQPAENIRLALTRFGEKFITFIHTDEVLAIRHALLTSENPGPRKDYFELGPKRVVSRVAAFLEEAMTNGQLKQGDPRVAACHLRGLLDSEHYKYYLLAESPSESFIRDSVKSAVDVFLLAYGANNAVPCVSGK
ncbi:MAG: TetR/AcrR family transcriptional regulator [Burkholderiaceae bacterium]|nr:TetR/AcrR family transcriptional regulator [Burkholderiaceae bacterium]